MSHRLTLVAIGGLANRMRAISSACALARDAGASLLVVWQPLPELAASFADLFRTDSFPFDVCSVAPWRYWCCLSDPRKRNLYVSSIYRRCAFDAVLSEADGSLMPYTDTPDALAALVKTHRDTLITTGLSFYPDEDIDYARIFVPGDAVRRRTAELLSPNDRSTIGIHIRRTDNSQSIANSPLRLFTDAIDTRLAEDPDTMFYVASDDPSTRQLLAQRYPANIHVPQVTLGRDCRQGIIDAAAEMLVLSRCSLIWGSYYSSFSEAAARIGCCPLRVIKR